MVSHTPSRRYRRYLLSVSSTHPRRSDLRIRTPAPPVRTISSTADDACRMVPSVAADSRTHKLVVPARGSYERCRQIGKRWCHKSGHRGRAANVEVGFTARRTQASTTGPESDAGSGQSVAPLYRGATRHDRFQPPVPHARVRCGTWRNSSRPGPIAIEQVALVSVTQRHLGAPLIRDCPSVVSTAGSESAGCRLGLGPVL